MATSFHLVRLKQRMKFFLKYHNILYLYHIVANSIMCYYYKMFLLNVGATNFNVQFFCNFMVNDIFKQNSYCNTRKIEKKKRNYNIYL